MASPPYRRHLERSADTLIDACVYVHETNVRGEIVEFGVNKGTTTHALAFGMSICSSNRSLHLFDSFSGLPVEPIDINAPHVVSGTWGAGRCSGGSADAVRKIVEAGGARFVKVHVGWFKDTVTEFKDQCALIHVDCDLYSSTMDCLVPLFERGQIAPGCIILFDDWNANAAMPEHGERRAWAEIVGRYEVKASDEGSYGVMCHKFIVHGYEP